MIISKSDLLRDFVDFQRRISKQSAGFLDPQRVHLVREGTAGFLPEDLAEIGRIDVSVLRNLPKRHAFPEVLRNIIYCHTYN